MRIPYLVAAAIAVLAVPAIAADHAKACQTAMRKVEREQRSLAAAHDAIARDRQARDTCSSRTVCARYDSAIAGTERRATRIASRLARFEAEVAQTCG
jgi:hypothetical protein